MSDSFNCRKCGLCCVATHDQEAFCDVDKNDLKKLDPRTVKKHLVLPTSMDIFCAALVGSDPIPPAAFRSRWVRVKRGPMKGVDVCACVFLRGSVMHQTSCRIYKNRPMVCKSAVKPGDRACRHIRRMVHEFLEER